MAQPSLGRHQTDRQGERGGGKAPPPPLLVVAQLPGRGNFWRRGGGQKKKKKKKKSRVFLTSSTETAEQSGQRLTKGCDSLSGLAPSQVQHTQPTLLGPCPAAPFAQLHQASAGCPPLPRPLMQGTVGVLVVPSVSPIVNPSEPGVLIHGK